MNYNNHKDFIEIEYDKKCKYCGKKNKIYKFGYCRICYNLILDDAYFLKPGVNFVSKSKKELVMEFLENPNVDKKELAQKYGISLRTVFYTINKFTIKKKIIK